MWKNKSKALIAVLNHYNKIVRGTGRPYASQLKMSYHQPWIGNHRLASDYLAALPGYDPNGGRALQLDIIDHDLGFVPGNLRWTTSKKQGRSRDGKPGKTNNRMITQTWQGPHRTETHNLSLWCEMLGVNYGAVRQRLRRGASEEAALTKSFRRSQTPPTNRDQ